MRGVYEKVKGSRDFYIRYTDDDGRRHREHVGSRAIAEEALINRRRQIREEKFVAPGKKKSELTFEEVFEQRMAAKQLAEETRASYKMHITSSRLKKIAKRPIVQITTPEMQSILNAIRDERIATGKEKPKERRGCSGDTVRNYRAFLIGVFSFALEAGYVKANPALETTAPKRSNGRDRFLDADEETAMRNTIRELYPEPEAKLAQFDLMLHTGMRVGEAWHLKWSHVHPDRGAIKVPLEGKTGTRHLPMNTVSRQAVKILHEQSNGSDYVIAHEGKGGKRYWARWIAKTAAKAGVLDVSMHTLRHTFASRLVTEGVNLKRVQEFMGHKNIAMTMKYAHLAPERGQADIERLVGPASVAPATSTPAVAGEKVARIA